jgi:hypothetical protein
MVVARLDLRIHSILLSNTRFCSLVSTYFGTAIPIGRTVNQSRLDILMTRHALKTCSVVALETLPKPVDVLSKIWVMAQMKLVLVFHGCLIPPPHGWSLIRRTASHGKVGGVTDVVGHIGVYLRCCRSDLGVMSQSTEDVTRPRRDLQSILKMAIGGNRCGPPKETRQSSLPVGQVVKTVRPGV